MTLVHLSDRRTAGDPDPAEVVEDAFGGMSFRAGRRTWAHLRWTQQQLNTRKPGAWIRILQGSYHTGYAPSAGSHDGDGVVDCEIVNWDDWPAEQRFLRDCGWADWWRHTGSWGDPTDWHHHMVSLGCPGPVGVIIPGQVADYYATPPRDGLKYHGSDPTPHPTDIDSTVFDYPAWLEETEMTPAQAQQLADTAAAVKEIAAKVEDIDKVLKRITKSKREVIAAVEDES